MSYYTRLQRTSEGYAGRVFEELWPEMTIRRAVARFMSEILGRAGAVSTAWSVTLDPESVRLNIGPVQLASFTRDRVWFCSATDERLKLPRWLHDISEGEAVYRSVPIPSRQYWIHARRFVELPRRVRTLTLRYVEAAASRRSGRSAWMRAHSPGVLKFLESFLALQLPTPGGSDVHEETRFDDCEATFEEGAPLELTRRTFERSRLAREACILRHGYQCAVCDVSMGERYGPVAELLIHVHHLVPMSITRKRTSVDASRDLRPLCPNCHAVIHLRQPPFSIEDMRSQTGSEWRSQQGAQ